MADRPPERPAPDGPPTASDRRTSDTPSVDHLDPFDLAMVGSGVLVLVFSFFDYYTISLKSRVSVRQLCDAVGTSNCSGVSGTLDQTQLASRLGTGGQTSDTASAWHGLFGWIGVLLLVVAAALVAVRMLAPGAFTSIANHAGVLVASAVGLAMVIVSLFVIPTGGNLSDEVVDTIFDLGHGMSFWVVLVLAIVLVAIAALRFAAGLVNGAGNVGGARRRSR